MFTTLLYAWENRDIATIYVSGAYLHSDMDEYTLLKIERETMDIMCRVNNEYDKCVCVKND